MTDLFHDKAADWDSQPVPVQISAGVSRALRDDVTASPLPTSPATSGWSRPEP